MQTNANLHIIWNISSNLHIHIWKCIYTIKIWNAYRDEIQKYSCRIFYDNFLEHPQRVLLQSSSTEYNENAFTCPIRLKMKYNNFQLQQNFNVNSAIVRNEPSISISVQFALFTEENFNGYFLPLFINYRFSCKVFKMRIL